jgi:acetylornithine aminotransferase
MKRAQALPLHALARKAATPRVFFTPQVFLRGIADKVPILLCPSAVHTQTQTYRTLFQPSTAYLKPTHTALPRGVHAQQSVERFKAHILPVYDRPEFVLHHGKGSYVWDTDGNKYLDFSAGIAVNALGHADEGVLKVCSCFPLCFCFTFFFFRLSVFLSLYLFCVFFIPRFGGFEFLG